MKTETETANTGATRSTLFEKGVGDFPIRLDLLLLNASALRRLGATYGEGEQKYGPVNWMKGFEESVFISHTMEHLLKWVSGESTEDDLAHAVWNLMTLMWVQDHKPELLNLQIAQNHQVATLQPETTIKPHPYSSATPAYDECDICGERYNHKIHNTP